MADDATPARRSRSAVDPDAYLERIGVDPATVDATDLPTLARLQSAHVTSVPFENTAIVGVPGTDDDGEGVRLSVPHLYEKVVERGRGGYCFELNGLFHCLLAELGYDVDRVAARVVGDGGVRLPANHHTNVVELDRRYVADVGTGAPVVRRPVPLDGEAVTDAVGVEWRVAASDRPDAAHRLVYWEPGDAEWSTRYVFDEAPRDLSYFGATNDYLQSAPESPFTGDVLALRATAEGHRKLSGRTLTERTADGEREEMVREEAVPTVLERAFDLSVDGA